uniref:Uncharacterized protein n=1 Tax=Cyclopterus lumpus TaxID=8103 RepID=A0A8C3GAJ6_CYCLU
HWGKKRWSVNVFPLMHFPRMSNEVLMFPASLRRSPLFWVLAHRSEPARSHKHNLMTHTFIHIKDMIPQRADGVHPRSTLHALLNYLFSEYLCMLLAGMLTSYWRAASSPCTPLLHHLPESIADLNTNVIKQEIRMKLTRKEKKVTFDTCRVKKK